MTALALDAAQALRLRFQRLDKVWLLIALLAALTALLAPAEAPRVYGIAISAFAGTLPFIAFAVLMVAMLKATGAEAMIGEAFKGREARMIVLASLIGGLAPFCSCEVIPFIAGLLAVGAPLSAVMAFWLSSPLMDPPTFAITAGALGWEFAVGKGAAAVGLGLAGGFAMAGALRLGWFGEPLKASAPVKRCGCGPALGSRKPVWRFWTEAPRRTEFREQLWENGAFLVKWLAFAYMIEGLMIVFVPAEAVGAVVGGDGVLPTVTGALVGMPAYLNGYAAPPLVAALMEQGMGAGAAMAFLTAGAVSSIPAMAAVWSLVKPQVFAAYVALGLTGAIAAGLMFAVVI